MLMSLKHLSCLSLLIMATGCASSSVLIRPPAPLSSAWGIAVYPVVFRFPLTPYESYVRGRDIADTISRETNCLAYGPGEFRVIDADDDDPRHGSTLLSAVRFANTHPADGLYALRTIVNRAIAQSEGAAVVDSSGRVRGVRRGDVSEEVTVRVELLSTQGKGIVAQLEQKVAVNLLEEPNADPYPDVTRVTGDLVEGLIKVAGLPPNRKSTVAGLKTVPTLLSALAFAPDGNPSLQAELKQLDALDMEAKMLGLVMRADPSASRARQKLYLHTIGLVVTEAAGPAAQSGLQPDDVVITADEAPVLGQYALDRILATGGARLHVKRGASETDIHVQTAGAQ